MTGIHEEDVDTSEATSHEAAAPVDTAPVEIAEPVEAAAPVETEATESASSDTATSPQINEPPAVHDWNGELDALKNSEWFSKMDSNLQGSVLEGLGSKYKNWQRGYTDKFQEMSSRRKELDQREADIKEEGSRVQRWLHGDVDPLDDMRKANSELKVAHRAEIDTLRREFTDATEKAQGSHGSALQDAIKEREAVQQQLETYRAKEAKIVQAEQAQSVEVFQNWVKGKSPKLLENDRAYDALCALLIADDKIDPNIAAESILSAYGLNEPVPEPEPTPEPIPESVDMMNMGMGSEGTQGGETRSVEEMIDQMRRAAQVDAATFMGS